MAHDIRVHAATNLLAGDGQHRGLILAGNLNHEPDALTTQLLHGPPGSEIGTAGFDRPDAGDGQRLWNPAPLIPENQRFPVSSMTRAPLARTIVTAWSPWRRSPHETVSALNALTEATTSAIEPRRDRRADLRRRAPVDDPTSAGIYCEVTLAQIDYALKAGTRTPPPSSPSLEETYAARPVHRLSSVAHARRGR